jgi:putative membrane protein
MKIRSEFYLAGMLSALLAFPVIVPPTAAAADSDGNSTMGSMKEGASDAAGAVKSGAETTGSAVKNGAESAGHAVKSGATKGYDTVKGAVTGSDSTTDNANLAEPDRTFVHKAAIAGLFEVEAAKVAKDKATSPDLKAFAERMVTDHTQANDELDQIAKKKNLDLPTELDAEHQRKLDALSKLSGHAFDKAYKEQQSKGHDQVLALMRNEAKNGKDDDLKSFAQKYESVIAEHDQMVKKAKVTGSTASSSTRTSSAGS